MSRELPTPETAGALIGLLARALQEHVEADGVATIDRDLARRAVAVARRLAEGTQDDASAAPSPAAPSPAAPSPAAPSPVAPSPAAPSPAGPALAGASAAAPVPAASSSPGGPAAESAAARSTADPPGHPEDPPASSAIPSGPGASSPPRGESAGDMPWARQRVAATPVVAAAPARAATPVASAPAPIAAPIIAAEARPATRETLTQIRADLGACERCQLHSSRSNIVFGVGNPDARLMFVGEAPGQQEDEQGEPFVGAAGQLLTKMIAAMGLSRDDVYIANLLKCRPPDNRNPMPDETARCAPFLVRQVHAVQPEVIVTLGRYATAQLLGQDVGLGRVRGTWHDYNGIRVMPTWHPSYLLRQPEAKRTAWFDLQQVMQALGLERPGGS